MNQYDAYSTVLSETNYGEVGLRTILASALELAREAVRLDTEHDSLSALTQYKKSVALLEELLTRTRAGKGDRENGATQGKQDIQRTDNCYVREGEDSKIQAILDTYTDRIAVLTKKADGPIMDSNAPKMYFATPKGAVAI